MIGAMVVVLVAAIAGGLYATRGGLGPHPTAPPTAGGDSPTACTPLPSEVFAAALATARCEHRAVPASRTYTDAELTDLLNSTLAGADRGLSNGRFHARSDETVQVDFDAAAFGLRYPITLIGRLVVAPANRIKLETSQTLIAGSPAPEFAATQLAAAAADGLDLGLPAQLREVRVAVADGSVTISAVAPAG